MKSKILTSIIVGGVCLGTLHISSVLANDEGLERATQRITSTNRFVADEIKEGKNSENIILQRREKDNLSNKKVLDILKKYGITSDGKSFEELQKELEEAIINDHALIKEKAKELGISTDNKSDDVLLKEIKAKLSGNSDEEAKKDKILQRRSKDNFNRKEVQDILNQHGITSDAKNFEELKKELNRLKDELIKKKAKELDISIEGKNEEELMKEIKNAVKE